MVSSILSTATSGLISTGLATNIRANNTVNALTPDFKTTEPQRTSRIGGGVEVVLRTGGQVELSTEILGLLQEEHAFKANAATFRTADELYKETTNLKD